MKSVGVSACGGWFFVFAFAGTQAQETKPLHKGVDPATVAAYEKLGAAYGAMTKTRSRSKTFLVGTEIAQGDLPAFKFKHGPKAKLPN